MALRAPLLLFVRLAAAPGLNALRTHFNEVLNVVENSQAKFVVVAGNADPHMINQIQGACFRHRVTMFYVPRQDELGYAARHPVRADRIVACAIVKEPRREGYTRYWINMPTELDLLQRRLQYQPNV